MAPQGTKVEQTKAKINRKMENEDLKNNKDQNQNK